MTRTRRSSGLASAPTCRRRRGSSALFQGELPALFVCVGCASGIFTRSLPLPPPAAPALLPHSRCARYFPAIVVFDGRFWSCCFCCRVCVTHLMDAEMRQNTAMMPQISASHGSRNPEQPPAGQPAGCRSFARVPCVTGRVRCRQTRFI